MVYLLERNTIKKFVKLKETHGKQSGDISPLQPIQHFERSKNCMENQWESISDTHSAESHSA